MATAISATAFIDTLGVNTHLGDAGAYSDTSTVEQNLEYLGVTLVRDSVDSASEAAVWQQVAQAAGIKFDDYMPEGAPAWDQSALALVPPLAQDGILAYVEGGNEEDDSYAQANGNSLSWTAQFQQQVYAMGQEYGLSVINMSFGSGWTAANNWEGDYPDVGNLSADTNYANAHTYPNVGQTPNDAIAALNSDAKLAASSRPVITTEIGWQTSLFSETQIAQYAVDATFDGIADGDAGMWFYGLYDDSSGDWGLFNADGTPRPAATALHDVTTLLADPNAPAGFTPGSLNYSLSDTQSGDNSILIEKSNGSFWIGLWNESGSQHTITVSLPSAASEIEVFDPITGTTAIESASNAASIAVSLGSDPLLIEIVPAGTGTGSGSGTGTGSGGTGTGSGSGSNTGSGSTGTGSSGSTSGSGTGSSGGSGSSGTSGSGSSTTPTGPSIAAPGSESTTTGSRIAISGVAITDAFAASNPGSLALTVSATSGDIAMTGANGTAVSGSGTHSISVSGTLAQINAELATLTYTAGDSAGSDAINIDVWDQAGIEGDKSIAVTVTGAASGSGSSGAAPTGPSIAAPASERVTAGATASIGGVSITDAFAASNPGALTLNLSATGGDIAMKAASGAAVAGSGTAAISVSGTLAQINADLATLTYAAGGSAGTGSVSIDVWDQAGLEGDKTIAVTVAAATTTPTGPSITLPASESVTAGTSAAVKGVSVTDASAASSPGTMILNVSAGSGDIAMTGANGTALSGSGTHAISVTGTLAQINADLATLSYSAASTDGSDTISIKVSDQSGLAASKTIAVAVTGTPPITIAAGNADPVELVSNAVITATSGNHMIFIGGTGDTVTATGGTETVQAYQGGNTITTGAGNDTISFGGSGNVIDAGAGSNTLQDSGSDNRIVMPGAGQGFDNIFGYVLQNSDTLDFRAALAGTSWNGSQSTLGNFVHLATSGNNAIIVISDASNGAASQVAELQGSGAVTLSTLLAHALT